LNIFWGAIGSLSAKVSQSKNTMEDITLLSQASQDMINGLREKEKSLLSEADLALLSARREYLTEEEKEKFFTPLVVLEKSRKAKKNQ